MTTFELFEDIKIDEYFIFQIAASHVSANAIIHFGHACLSKVSRLPVHYVFPHFKFDPDKLRQEFQRYFANIDEEILVFYATGFVYGLGILSG